VVRTPRFLARRESLLDSDAPSRSRADRSYERKKTNRLAAAWVVWRSYGLLGKVMPVNRKTSPHGLLMCPQRGYLTMEAIANSPTSFGVWTEWLARRPSRLLPL
jgi:hypothetical protein